MPSNRLTTKLVAEDIENLLRANTPVQDIVEYDVPPLMNAYPGPNSVLIMDNCDGQRAINRKSKLILLVVSI
jgi:hypothetical protein